MLELLQSPQLNKVCQENNIEYLGLFGSYARGDNTEQSDIDLLVRFAQPIGYFKLISVEHAFEDLLGVDVDLVTENALSKYIKPNVYKDIKVLYGS